MINAYNNIPYGFIFLMLSYMRAFSEQGYRVNTTYKRKTSLAKGSKRTGQAGYEYFVSYGKGTRSGRQHLAAGIYKRVSISKGSAIKPIMMFTKDPSYQKRFPFYEVVQQTINATLMDRFNEAMKDALMSARRTG